MAMQWDFEGCGGVGVLRQGGYPRNDGYGQLSGAVGWALTRGDGPIVIDLTHLLGCSAGGASAIGQAAHRTAGHQRAVAPPVLGGDPARQSVRDHPDRQAAMRGHTGLAAAVAAVGPHPTPAPRPPALALPRLGPGALSMTAVVLTGMPDTEPGHAKVMIGR